MSGIGDRIARWGRLATTGNGDAAPSAGGSDAATEPGADVSSGSFARADETGPMETSGDYSSASDPLPDGSGALESSGDFSFDTSGPVASGGVVGSAADLSTDTFTQADQSVVLDASADVSENVSKWNDVSYDIQESELDRTVVADEEKKAGFGTLLSAWGEQAKTVPMPSGEVLHLDDDGNPMPAPESADLAEDPQQASSDDESFKTDTDSEQLQGDSSDQFQDGDSDIDLDDSANLVDDESGEFVESNTPGHFEDDHGRFGPDSDSRGYTPAVNSSQLEQESDDGHYEGEDMTTPVVPNASSALTRSRDADPDDIEADVVLRDDEVDEDSDLGSGLIPPREFDGFSQSRPIYEEESEGQPSEAYGNSGFFASERTSIPSPSANPGIEDYTSVVLKPAQKKETPEEEKHVPEYANFMLKPSGRSMNPSPEAEPQPEPEPLKKAASVGFKETASRAVAPAASAPGGPSSSSDSRASWRKKSGSRTPSANVTPETPDRKKSRISGFLALFGRNRSSRTGSGSMSRKSSTKTSSTARTAPGQSAALSGATASGSIASASAAVALATTAASSGSVEPSVVAPSGLEDRSMPATSGSVGGGSVSLADSPDIHVEGALPVVEEELPTVSGLVTEPFAEELDEEDEIDSTEEHDTKGISAEDAGLDEDYQVDEVEDPLVRLRTGEARVVGLQAVGPPIKYQRLKSVAISIPGNDQVSKSAKGPNGLSVYLLGAMARVTQRAPNNRFFSKTIKEHGGKIVDAMWFPETDASDKLSALATTDNSGMAMVHFFWTVLDDGEPVELRHLRTIHIRFPKSPSGSYYTKARAFGSPSEGRLALVPDDGLFVRIVEISAHEEFDPDLEAPAPIEVPEPPQEKPLAVFVYKKDADLSDAAPAPHASSALHDELIDENVVSTESRELSGEGPTELPIAEEVLTGAEKEISSYPNESSPEAVLAHDPITSQEARELSTLSVDTIPKDESMTSPLLLVPDNAVSERADVLDGEIIEGAEIVEEEVVADVHGIPVSSSVVVGINEAPVADERTMPTETAVPDQDTLLGVRSSTGLSSSENAVDTTLDERDVQPEIANKSLAMTGVSSVMETAPQVHTAGYGGISSQESLNEAPTPVLPSQTSLNELPTPVLSSGMETPGMPSGIETPEVMSSGIATPIVPPPAPILDSGFATPAGVESEASSVANESVTPIGDQNIIGAMPDRHVGGFEAVRSAGSIPMSGSATPGTPAPPLVQPVMSGATTPGLSQYSSLAGGDDTPLSERSGASTPSLAPEAPVLPSFPGSGNVSGTDTPLSGVYSGASTPPSEIPPVPTLPSLNVSGLPSGADTPISYSGTSTPRMPEAAPEFPTMSGTYTPLSDGGSGSGTETPGLVPGTPPALPSFAGSGSMTPLGTSGISTPQLGSVANLPTPGQVSVSSLPASGMETPETPLQAPSLPSMPLSGELTPGSVTSGSSIGGFPDHGAPPSLPSGPASLGSTEASTPVMPQYADRPTQMPGMESGMASSTDTPLLGTPAAAMTPPAFETPQRYDSAESVTLPSPPKLPSFSDINRIPPPPVLPDMPEPETEE